MLTLLFWSIKNINTDFSLQKQIFKAHITLSENIKKPLIIHCVKSFSEVIAIKKEMRPQQLWVLHGFRKNITIANELIKNNIKLSFGKALLEDEKLQNILATLSIENFFFFSTFLETDDADICIQKIYQKASEIKGISVEDLNLLLSQNFSKF